MADEQKSLAVQNGQQPQPVQVSNPNDLSAGVSTYWTSMDLSKPGARSRLFTALQNADRGVADILGTPINLVDVVAHNVLVPNADGTAMVERTRIVLIDAEGVMYSCVSEGIKKSLQTLFQLVGRPPFNPPLTVVPKQVGTKRGFRTYLFELSNDQFETAAGESPGKPKKK